MTSPDTIPLRDADELDDALEEPVAILYKHSPLCGLSSMALREVREFIDESPDVPVYLVDVIGDRPVSREVERRLSIRHESPQAFVLRSGEVVWHGSHRAVTGEALTREVEASVDL